MIHKKSRLSLNRLVSGSVSVALALGLGIPLAISDNESVASQPEFDVSGTGTCTQVRRRITIRPRTHIVWAQSPRSAATTTTLVHLNFVGKNGIVIMGDRHELVTVISTPNGEDPFVLEVDEFVNLLNGTCQYTLDPVSAKTPELVISPILHLVMNV